MLIVLIVLNFIWQEKRENKIIKARDEYINGLERYVDKLEKELLEIKRDRIV